MSQVGTTSVTSTLTNTVFDETFTFQPQKGAGYCYWHNFRYRATSNQRIQGTVQSGSPVTFYVFTAAAYQEWRNFGSCEPFGQLLKSPLSGFYSLDWTVPKDDTYQFVIFWMPKPNENPVSFHAWSTYVGAPVSFGVYTTMTKIVATTMTLTSKSVFTQELSQAFSLGQNQMLVMILAVVTIAVVLAAVFFAYRSRSGKRQVVSSKEQVAPLCKSCGTPLVPNSKFCKKCGKPVA